MSGREIISENSMKGIDSPSPKKSDRVIDINNIEFITRADQQPISTTNIISSKINYKKISAYMIFIILIIIAMIGMVILILYFINDNIHYCLNENIFNKNSTFINTCISTIR